MLTFALVDAAPRPLASVPTAAPVYSVGSSPELLARDAAGMVWAHANPAELYRWIARRNDLLNTIAVASRGSAVPAHSLRAN